VKLAAVAVAAVAVLAAGAGTVAVTVAVRSGEALPGTTVEGVDVGGLGPGDIERELADEARARERGRVVLLRGTDRLEVSREALGVQVDLAETAERAVQAGRGGVLDPLLAPLRDEQRDVDLAVDVDEDVVDRRLRALAEEVARDPQPGGFTVQGTTVTPQPPQPGRRLDAPAAREALLEALRSGRGEVRVPIEEIAPQVTPKQVEAVTVAARRALAEPHRLTFGDGALSVQADELAPLLSAQLREGQLELVVDRAGLRELVASRARQIDQPARSARFEVGAPPTVDEKGSMQWRPRPAQVRVVPGAVGREVDVEAATDRLLGLVHDGGRTAELPVRTTPPALTTEQAQGAGVRQLIGTFTTYFQPGQPRVTNINRIADIVDGTYVAPGEVFSLNGTAGRRTRARGFVADSAIIDGELEDVVGGGVSQFATTLFNAAFFAGLPILQHQPHSFYISRYPPGRESTVNFGTIDVRFRNDTGHGLWIDTRATDSSVTVALYGDNGGRQVQAQHGPREPREGGGFRIAVTRVVTGGDGKGGRRVFTTTYNPPPED
jgi:vancomycin resistance protein YoaR